MNRSAQSSRAKLHGVPIEEQDQLAVLARCVQLQEAIAVLELDRVENSAPDELDRHRIGLRTARENRIELITRATGRLLERMDAAAEHANAKVLLHPSTSPQIVRSSGEVKASVIQMNDALGIGHELEALAERRWKHAASDVKDRAVDRGKRTASGARREASEGVDQAKRMVGRFTQRADRTQFWREAGTAPKDDAEA